MGMRLFDTKGLFGRAESARKGQADGVLSSKPPPFERLHLSRELHDGLAQSLAIIVLQLETARLDLKRRGRAESDVPQLISALDESRAGMKEVRRLIDVLRGVSPPTRGLRAGLGELKARWARGRPRCHIEIRKLERSSLSRADEAELLRVVQEAVSNAVRHGGADHVLIELETRGEPEGFSLRVRDDGAGLAPGWRLGIGVRSMRERSRGLRGQFLLRSPRSGGCEVVVSRTSQPTPKELTHG